MELSDRGLYLKYNKKQQNIAEVSRYMYTWLKLLNAFVVRNCAYFGHLITKWALRKINIIYPSFSTLLSLYLNVLRVFGSCLDIPLNNISNKAPDKIKLQHIQWIRDNSKSKVTDNLLRVIDVFECILNLYSSSIHLNRITRKPLLWTPSKVSTRISLSMLRRITRTYIFHPLVDLLFQKSLLYTSIPLRRNVSARINLRGLRMVI